jgi:hypothetical protein
VAETITEEAKDQLEALLHESEQVHATISRAFTTVHNIVGLFLPASVGLFVLGAKDLHDVIGIDLLALILAATFCIARLYADTLWTEVLAYWEYNYAVLQPRIYACTKQEAHRNLGQTLLKGWPCASSFPMLGFHIMTFVFVTATTVYGVVAYAPDPPKDYTSKLRDFPNDHTFCISHSDRGADKAYQQSRCAVFWQREEASPAEPGCSSG